jgi:hypothetical protein
MDLNARSKIFYFFCKKSIYIFIRIMTHIRPNKKISKYDQINVKIDQ